MKTEKIGDLLNEQSDEQQPPIGFYNPATHEVWTGSEWIQENILDESITEQSGASEDEYQKILTERANQYGSFEDNLLAITSIMNTLRDLRDPKPDEYISPEDVENFFLALKLTRMQRADDPDSLIDLANYAKLIKERRFGASE